MTEDELRKTSLLDYLDALGFSYRQENQDSYRDIQLPDGHIASSFTYSKSKNTWNYHAKGVSGFGAYDYIKKIEGVTAPRDIIDKLKAVMGIDDVQRSAQVQQRIQERKERDEILNFSAEVDDGQFHLPAASPTTNELRNCLCKRRGIDQEILDFFIDRGLVYESNTPWKRPEDGKDIYFHNAIFVARDSAGTPRAATWKALTPTKDPATGKEKYRGEQVKHGEHNNYAPYYIAGSKTSLILVFEAFIDAMAYLTLQKEKGRAWTAFSFICLEGLTLSADRPITTVPPALRRLLDEHPDIKNIVCAFDNDKAGTMAAEFFTKTLGNYYNVVTYLPEKMPRKYTHGEDGFIKDWCDICMERLFASQAPTAEQEADALLAQQVSGTPSIT